MKTAWCMFPGDMANPISISFIAFQFLKPTLLYCNGLFD